MPNLPTKNVTDAMAQRIFKAFEGDVDDPTAMEPVPLAPKDAFLRWFTSALTEEVIRREKALATDSLGSDLG